MFYKKPIIFTVILALLIFIPATVLANSQQTRRVSIATSGAQGNDESFGPSISASGRYVAFNSRADNLVGSNDINGEIDVFRHDRATDQTTLISTRAGTTVSAFGFSFAPSISDDGCRITFTSSAHNVVIGDTNGVFDIFLYDCQSSSIDLISINNGIQGTQGSMFSQISGDGRFVVYTSLASFDPADQDGSLDVYRYEVSTKTTQLVSRNAAGVSAHDHAVSPAISHDGNVVTFWSSAYNLVPGDTMHTRDLFYYDLSSSTPSIERVTAPLASSGPACPSFTNYPNSVATSIGGNGTIVAYSSGCPNHVSGDTNNVNDVFVWSRINGTTERISVGHAGAQGNGASMGASMSDNGRYIAFSSAATNLFSYDNNNNDDIYVHDTVLNSISRVTIGVGGTQPNGGSGAPVLSADGSIIAFDSYASNLIAGDTNNSMDVFVNLRTAITPPQAPQPNHCFPNNTIVQDFAPCPFQDMPRQ